MIKKWADSDGGARERAHHEINSGNAGRERHNTRFLI